jgi:hypothetical protein
MARIVNEIVICDRCKKEQNVSPLVTGLPIVKIMERTCRKLIIKSPYYDDGWKFRSELELCSDCLKSLRNWFDDGVKNDRGEAE